MQPFIHLTGSTFQYTDTRAYTTHLTRVSPSAFYPVLSSSSDSELAHHFDCLGQWLYHRTEDVLASGGLFHIKAFARQMLQFDQELRRRSGGEWANRDLSRTRTALETIANINILPPRRRIRRRRRQPEPPVRRFGRSTTPDPVGQPYVDPEDALAELLHPLPPPRPLPPAPRYRSALDWILGETTSESNVAPGVNATPDGATMIGGLRIRMGQAGNFPRMQRQFIAEGEADAQRDFRSGRRRRERGRYQGNSDYRAGYNRRWRELERSAR